MRYRRITQRLDDIETALAGSMPCSSCYGTGIDRIDAHPEGAPWPEHRPCAECGRLSFRQHVVHGVTSEELDRLFQPAAPRSVAPYFSEN